MSKDRNLSVVPKTKARKSTVGKNVNRAADDAAKKAQKTEQKVRREARDFYEVTYCRALPECETPVNGLFTGATIQ